MNKVIAVCGKICCGKTYYSNILKEKEQAVILSCDELTNILFDNKLGEKHDEMSVKIWEYLILKSVDIVKANSNVILDWGFWSKKDRSFIKKCFSSKNIPIEIHYVKVNDSLWEKNIEERNKKIEKGEDISNYFIDDGLMKKFLNKWEEPEESEIDYCYEFER